MGFSLNPIKTLRGALAKTLGKTRRPSYGGPRMNRAPGGALYKTKKK